MIHKLLTILLFTSYTAFSQVAPILSTTWNQGCYYNQLCPSDPAGACGKVFTGCNATAMAQLMKYYNHPATGWGSSSYTHSTYGTLSADFAATIYNWAAMPNSLSANNTDIATLMFHLGVAVDMNYSPSNSTSSANGHVFKKYFKYSLSIKGAIKTSNTQWENLIKAELDAGRPVFATGGSHFYVIDGYQISPLKFHCNFGWGGSYDGYYDLNSIVVAGTNYSPGSAIIGIKPLASVELSPDTLEVSSLASSSMNFEISSLASWNISSNQSWLTPNTSSGGEGYYNFQNGATATVSTNNSYTTRYAKLIITSGANKDSLVIKQNGITPTLSCSLSSLTYAFSSSSQSVSISSDSIWTASSSDSWISVTPSSGTGNDNISITVTANLSVSRTGSVVIKRGSIQRVITLYQAAAGSFWCVPSFATSSNVGATNIKLNTINRNSTTNEGYINTGVSTILKIDTTYSFSATFATASGMVAPAVWIDWNIDGDFNDAGEAIVAPSSSWYPSNPGTKSVNFTVPSGAIEGTTRMRVYIKAFGGGPVSGPCNTGDTGGDIEDYTIVVRNHKYISVTPSSLLYPYASATQSSAINTDSNWTASSSETWFSFTPTSGIGNQNLDITTTYNDALVSRSAVLTVTRGSKIKTIVITQQAADTVLYLMSGSVTIISTGELSSFEINSNIQYSISSPDSWIHLDSSVGTGSKTYSFSVDMNPTSSSRSGSIIISKGNYTQTFTVDQDGTSATLNISKTSITATETGNTETFDITTPGGWTVSSSDSWITASPTSGSGNATITVTISSNADISSRSATLTITNGLVVKTITVDQSGVTDVMGVVENQEMKIYPNPVTDVLMVQANEIEALEVFNALGEKKNCTVEKKGDLLQVNMDGLSQGIYIVKVENEVYRIAKE